MNNDPNKLRPGLELDEATKRRLNKNEQQRNVVWPTNRTFAEKHKWTKVTAEAALKITEPRSSKK